MSYNFLINYELEFNLKLILFCTWLLILNNHIIITTSIKNKFFTSSSDALISGTSLMVTTVTPVISAVTSLNKNYFQGERMLLRWSEQLKDLIAAVRRPKRSEMFEKFNKNPCVSFLWTLTLGFCTFRFRLLLITRR